MFRDGFGLDVKLSVSVFGIGARGRGYVTTEVESDV